MVRMGYQYKSINDIMKMINNCEIYLPAIQRKFVWGYWWIDGLFDLIMHRYLIDKYYDPLLDRL